MKLLLFILLIRSPILCLSQEWGANHAVWYYSQILAMPPFDNPYIKYATVGDTIILGKNAKIISEEFVSLNYSSSSKIFMTSDSGRVYYFVPEINQFRQIYDFNAIPGDTITVFCPYILCRIQRLIFWSIRFRHFRLMANH